MTFGAETASSIEHMEGIENNGVLELANTTQNLNNLSKEILV